MEFFSQLFVVLLLICVCIEVVARKGFGGNKNVQHEQPGFKAFQRTYLVVYLINMAADWMQGPYVYALYESYGFQKGDIAILFIGGFFSSMMFGTFVGGMADKYGRKSMAVVFGILYSISCITKLWNDFYILLLGRLLGGIATSLLFSVFEAWMVYEHHKRGYSIESLSQTFSYATFGNGCVAILSSLAASFVADAKGYVAPFMLSLFLLIVGTVIVTMFWSENYGDTTVDIYSTFLNASEVLRNDTKITVLGLTQSLFEASMYTFVFMWTPALQEEDSNSDLPFGVIFACYMVSIMIGSSLFNIIISKFNIAHEVLAQYVFAIAAIALFLPTLTQNQAFSAICFCLFEVTCGMYWPCLGTIRGKYIPETSRAAIMNFFRVPLNLLVVIVLVKISSFKNDTVFLICTAWLVIAVAGQNWFVSHVANSQQKKFNEPDIEMTSEL